MLKNKWYLCKTFSYIQTFPWVSDKSATYIGEALEDMKDEELATLTYLLTNTFSSNICFYETWNQWLICCCVKVKNEVFFKLKHSYYCAYIYFDHKLSLIYVAKEQSTLDPIKRFEWVNFDNYCFLCSKSNNDIDQTSKPLSINCLFQER